jgi:hypothetical protein
MPWIHDVRTCTVLASTVADKQQTNVDRASALLSDLSPVQCVTVGPHKFGQGPTGTPLPSGSDV